MKTMKKIIALLAVIAMAVPGLPMVSMAAPGPLTLQVSAKTVMAGETVEFTVTDEKDVSVDVQPDQITCYEGALPEGTEVSEDKVKIGFEKGIAFNAMMKIPGTYTFRVEMGTSKISNPVSVTVEGDDTPGTEDTEEPGAEVDAAAVQASVFAGKIAVGIAGSNRTATSIMLADEVKKALGMDGFGTIIVATGADFADGLTVSQLSIAYKAPILLATKGTQADVKAYIEKNLAAGGEVIIAGGTGVISGEFADGLTALKTVNKVRRLAGANRYDTNIAILNDAMTSGQVGRDEILIASGSNFADALSASATGKAIMIVGRTLTDSQTKFLTDNKFGKVTILGGEGAVSKDIELDLNDVTGIEAGRVAGANRLETSSAIAKEYFAYTENICSVYAKADVFADGLSGGLLANLMQAPIRLAYSSKDITAGGRRAVLGGIK